MTPNILNQIFNDLTSLYRAILEINTSKSETAPNLGQHWPLRFTSRGGCGSLVGVCYETASSRLSL